MRETKRTRLVRYGFAFWSARGASLACSGPPAARPFAADPTRGETRATAARRETATNREQIRRAPWSNMSGRSGGASRGPSPRARKPSIWFVHASDWVAPVANRIELERAAVADDGPAGGRRQRHRLRTS